MSRAWLLMLALAACKQPVPLRVAAASDLMLAFDELARVAPTKRPVSMVYGSSGLLARQLREGAPFDVFASADEAAVDSLIAAGVCEAASRRHYATGRLAVVGGAGFGTLQVAELVGPAVKRIAIANPEHAPYGRAAKEALLQVGVWAQVQQRLVYADNVQQALRFVESGNADAALVAASLLRGQTFTLVDASLHAPLTQTLVVCSKVQPEAARAFAEYLSSELGQALLESFRFERAVGR